MREAVSGKKDAHKVMCRNSNEENKRKHKYMKIKATKLVSKAMKGKAGEAPTELNNA